MDPTGFNDAVFHQRHNDREVFFAVGKVVSTVHWVDDPYMAGAMKGLEHGPVFGNRLLTDNSSSRQDPGKLLGKERLTRQVGGGDEVVRPALGIDVMRFEFPKPREHMVLARFAEQRGYLFELDHQAFKPPAPGNRKPPR